MPSRSFMSSTSKYSLRFVLGTKLMEDYDSYADVKEAAELENMDEVGTYLDHKRNSRITYVFLSPLESRTHQSHTEKLSFYT
jgi:hypothetical protein